jgi:hypothetical protein
MRNPVLIFFLLIFAVNSPAQSGRARPPSPDYIPASTAAELPSVEKLFTETSDYAKKKFEELEKSRTPYSPAVYEQVLREQRQMAARYVMEVSARPELSADDTYFFGLLQNLSTNFDGAIDSFRKFLASEKPEAEKAQRARFLLVAGYAVKKKPARGGKFPGGIPEKLADKDQGQERAGGHAGPGIFREKGF